VDDAEAKTWEAWLADKANTVNEITQKEIQFLTDLPKKTILSKITSFDFAAIAGGTGGAHKDALQ